jgi:hypothetical protein
MEEFPTQGFGYVINSAYINNTNGQVLRCRKIVLKPTKLQRDKLKQWFEWYTYGYNQAIRRVNELVHTKNSIPSFITLREQVKNRISGSIMCKIEESGIPAHTFDNSIRDVIKLHLLLREMVI